MVHRPERLQSARLFRVYLVLEHAREILREETITPLRNPVLPKTQFPWITYASLSCKVGPVAHIHLDMAPNTGYAQTATPSVFTDSVSDDFATEVLLAHTKRVDAPSCLNEAPIGSAAPSPLMAPRSQHFCHSPAEPPRCIGSTAAPHWIWDRRNTILFAVWMYILPNEVQCDALSCLPETDECAFSHSPQLAPGNLVRLDGSPTILAYDGPNPSSCFVFSR